MQVQRVLSTIDSARYVGLAAATLERYRHVGGGPAFIRLGSRRIVYEVAALDAWLDRQKGKASKALLAR